MNSEEYSTPPGYESVDGIEVVDDTSPYDLDCFNLIWDEGIIVNPTTLEPMKLVTFNNHLDDDLRELRCALYVILKPPTKNPLKKYRARRD